MKRIFRTALLVLLIASLFCTVAYAEDNGIQSVTVQNGVTLTPQLADKTAVTPITVDEVVYYPGSERMDLACSAGIVADAEYVVMVLKGAEATPSTESIVYIDQLKASGSSVTFNLYPLALAVDTEYHVYLASNAEGSEGLVEVASFLFGAPVDKTELQAAITAAQALTETDYTAESWAAMQTALTAANEVFENADATQAEVDAAKTALNSAVDALVVDKAALQTAITAADALVEADYTADSWTAMQTALTSAKAVLAKEDATPAEVSAAVTALNSAVDALVVDKAALQTAITAADALVEADYTADSWTAMQTALTSAKAVLAKEDATPAEVSAATTALNEAVAALVPVAPAVDKTALQAAITAAEALTETDYTAESWSAMQTALTAAKAVLENADATQAEVDTATTALNDAVTALVPATPAEVDKSQLEAAIAYAEGLTASDYTADSWAAVQTALNSAKTVYAKADATQDEVDNAQITLDNAVAALVPKGDEPFRFDDVTNPNDYFYKPVYWAVE
ncbi:MAG: FIVAR domain-containing protein, partial [Oscillospiraceae bacterium]|nr:FIVAR domain-containing protein [Oscillospiraceae bacterium]MBR0392449.1 FIVAR domain-containing protein [Oscillospiraceae bacterium]